MTTRLPARALAAVALLLGGASGCTTPERAPSLLDREFDAYRLDRTERRLDDAKEREALARAEADRAESELAALLRRAREARARCAEARTDAEDAERDAVAAAALAAERATRARAPRIPPSLPPGPLPAPAHRTSSGAPR